MKTFLAVYIGTATAREKADWDAMPEAQRKQREQESVEIMECLAIPGQ